jgi:CDGSH-type Zn-finger protein
MADSIPAQPIPAQSIPAQKSPYGVEVRTGKTHYCCSCSCGRSQKQPFCDGSHKPFGLSPQPYQASASKAVWFCGCKATKDRPLCDDTHKTL